MEEVYKRSDAHGLQKTMRELYDEGLFTDIKLNVGGVIFKAHKPVLYSNSPMLKSMLTKETADKYKEEIELKGLDPHYFGEVLLYMYTETITIRSKNIIGILKTADYLEINELRQFCLSILENYLTPDNALEFFQTAHLLNNAALKMKSRSMIFEHLTDKQAELNQCSLSDFQTILFDDVCDKTNASTLYRTVILWINYDANDREKEFAKLMTFMDFSSTSGTVLSELIHDDLVKKHPEVRENLIAITTDRLKRTESEYKTMKTYIKESRIFTFDGIYELDDELFYSQNEAHFPETSWDIGITKEESDGEMWLFTHVQCDSVGSQWSCSAMVEFNLIPVKDDGETLKVKFDSRKEFSQQSSEYGVRFLKWSELTKPDNGYITETGKIIIAINIDAQPVIQRPVSTPTHRRRFLHNIK